MPSASYRLPQGCTAGYLARWNGSAWECVAADAHNHDTTCYTKTQLQTSGSAAVHWLILPGAKPALVGNLSGAD